MLNSMKAVNLWKTLFCAALALTTFSACSDDDKDDDGGMPSITVNGEASTTVAVKLDGGTTDAIEVVSTGSWVLTLDDETATWCHPSKETGSKGKTTLTFTVDKWEGAASDAERSVTAKLLTNGSFEGIPIPKTATVIVKQNGDGSTVIATNVKTIRDQLTFGNTGTEITSNMVITGIVVSDYVGNNINNHQIMLTDDTTEPGAGLMVRFKGYVGSKDTDYNLTRGSIVSFDLKGGKSQSYFGTYQVEFTTDPTITIEDKGDNTPAPIAVEDVSKLAEYQSQYVQVYSQPAADIIGQKYYSEPINSGYANKTFVTRTGESFSLSFGSYTKDWSGAVEIPGKSGNIKGCVSINANLGNISPRNADDLKGMTEPLFEVETTTTKISEITAEGSYTIEKATVVSISAKSFVIGDGTGYICVYKTTAQTVAVGDLVTVAGAVAPYAKGMEGKTALQFDAAAEVTKETGTGTITVPAPQVVAGGEIDNITPLKYVTVTGKLTKSGNFYNIAFSDYTGEQTGSLLDAPASLNAADYDGLDVKVTGWYVYTNSTKYFNIIADKIELVSTDPVVKFTSIPSAFAAENPVAQTVEYVAMNVTGNPTFEISEGAEYFEVGTITATTVEVKAKGNNTTNAAFNGKLVAKVAGVEKTSIGLKQSAPSSGDNTKGYSWMANLYTKDSYDSKTDYWYFNVQVKPNGETTEYPFLKLAKSKTSGVYTTPVLGVTGDKKLSFYAVGWTGVDSKVYVRVNNGGSVSPASVDVTANSGFSGSGNTYTMTLTDSDYYTFELKDLTATSTLTISTSATFEAGADSANKSRAGIIGLQIY